jgi:hypothetical protein
VLLSVYGSFETYKYLLTFKLKEKWDEAIELASVCKDVDFFITVVR